MIDREKVIKEYEFMVRNFVPACTSDERNLEIMEEILCMLKEQEPVVPIKPLDKDDDYTYLCSNCKNELFLGDTIRDNYCSSCGRLVKWE